MPRLGGVSKKTKNQYSNIKKRSGLTFHKNTFDPSRIPKSNDDIIFIGLDLSVKNTGLCIKEPNKPYKLTSIPTERLPVKSRYSKHIYIWNVIYDELSKLDKTKKILICCELYAMYGTSIVQTAELGGFIRTMLEMHKLEFHDISPNEAKLFATGKGDADKTLMIQCMSKKLNIIFNNDDEADSSAMCLFIETNIDKFRRGEFL